MYNYILSMTKKKCLATCQVVYVRVDKRPGLLLLYVQNYDACLGTHLALLIVFIDFPSLIRVRLSFSASSP